MGKASSAKRAASKIAHAGTNITPLKLATPKLSQRGPEIQKYGTRIQLPIGLSNATSIKSIEILNQVLADTICIRDMYKKHHWQVAGASFYQLHLLYDKHYTEQSDLVDMLAERIQMLGGISLSMSADIAEETKIARPPRGREEVPVQISRLTDAHNVILKEARDGAKKADDNGDDGTNDLLVSNIIRTNEMHIWFISEHLAPEDLVIAG